MNAGEGLFDAFHADKNVTHDPPARSWAVRTAISVLSEILG